MSSTQFFFKIFRSFIFNSGFCCCVSDYANNEINRLKWTNRKKKTKTKKNMRNESNWKNTRASFVVFKNPFLPLPPFLFLLSFSLWLCAFRSFVRYTFVLLDNSLNDNEHFQSKRTQIQKKNTHINTFFMWR